MHIRTRIRKIPVFLVAIALVASLTLSVQAQPAHAATTWTVTNLNDVGIGSLRNTIGSATSGDTIVFQSGLTGTIVLSSQLTIDKSLRIIGPGAGSLTISGNNQCRVLKVTNGDVSISSLTVANGKAVGNGGHYGYDGFGGGGGGGGGATGGGGGLLIYGGTVTLDSVVFANNSAVGGNGGHGGDGWQSNPSPDGDGGRGGDSDLIPGSFGGDGGHTQNGKTGGDVVYGGNYSGGGGGYGGNANYNSYIQGGDAGSGGNAYSLGGRGGSGGNQANATFYYNKAGYGGDGGQGGGGYGGAIALTGGSLYVANSAFTGNSASGGVGGAAGSSNFRLSGGMDWYFGGSGGNGGDGKGGAIYVGGSAIGNATVYKPGTVMIANSTFSGNSAHGGAGGYAGSAPQVGNLGDAYADGVYNGGTIGYKNLTGDAIGSYAGNVYELSGPNSARSTVTASPSSVSTDGGTSTITVVLKDSGGNPVFGDKVSLIPKSGNPVISPVSASTDSHGQAIFTLSSSQAGAVVFEAKDTTVGMTVDQAVTVTFTPGLTNAQKSTVTASPSSLLANGSDASIITVQLKDQNGNPVGGGKSVTLSQNGNSVISPVSGVTDSAGQVAFNVTDSYTETVTYVASNTTNGVTLAQTAVVDFTPYVWSVTSLDDSLNPGTLRHAVNYAPAGTSVTFQKELTGIIALQSALPAIGRNLVIDGYGANVTISGNGLYRVFEVTSGVVSIKNLTVANGKAAGSVGVNGAVGDIWTGGNGYSGSAGGHGQGGGLLVTDGTVSIENVAFQNNLAAGGNGGNGGSSNSYFRQGGTGADGGFGQGGAVYLANGTLTITGSTFAGNRAIGGHGGQGGHSDNGAIVGYAGNSGHGSGGAVFVNAGSLTIMHSQFSNDSATGGNGGSGQAGRAGGNGCGGAIYLADGTLGLADVRFFNESVTAGVGGTGYYANGQAGSAKGSDLYKQSGAITLSDVAFDSDPNSYYNTAPAVVEHSTVTVDVSDVNSGGVAFATIAVTLRDANGIPVGSGKTVTLSQESGRSVISPSIGTTDGNGVATFHVSDVYGETVTYTARDTADGFTLPETMTVHFLAPDPGLCLIEASASSITADGSEQSTITVTLRHANGDPAPGKAVTLSQADGHSVISPASTATTNSSGQAVFTIANGYVETVTYTARNTTDDSAVPGSVEVTFTPYQWVVSSLADTDLPGTLRHAISHAPSGSTISVQSGLNGTITLGSSLPTINRDLTIDGTGATLTISGNNQHRVFRVDAGTVSIKNLTIADGRSAGSNGPVDWNGGNGGHAYGGGLYIAGGTVSIYNVTFDGNQAIGGRGGDGYSHGAFASGQYGGRGGDAYGGSIYLSAGTLTITRSRFDGNSAIGSNGGNAPYTDVSTYGGGGGSGYGGAIYASSGSLTITDSQFANNTVASGLGGTGVNANGSDGVARYADLCASGGTCAVSDVSFGSGSYSYYNPAPADSGRSTVTASPTSARSDGKTAATITVTLKFANGDPAPGKQVILSQGTGSSTITPVNNGLANNDGTATFTVTDTVAETVTYTAKVTSDNVTVAQTAAVTFTPSDPASSSITASPAAVTANASDVSTITVTLKFANGDPAAGKPVTLSQGSGHSLISPAIAITGPNGQAAFTVRNGHAETVTYTAKDTMGSVVVSETAAVAFTPSTWVVNSLDDTGDIGTLRHAMNYAQSGTTITFQSGLNGTITLGSSLPAINRDLTIDGAGATVAISGNNQYRVFRVDAGTVSIKNLTVAQGRSAGSNGSNAYPTGGSGEHGMGGGMFVTGGMVLLDHVAFNGNKAIGGIGGGDANCYRGGWGGGGYGGAICLDAGSLTIQNSRFDGCSVIGNTGGYGWYAGGGGGNGYGGAIFLFGGSLTITDSQFSSNTVTAGQGGYKAGSNGGALYADLYVYGGACTASNVSFGSGSNSYYNPAPADAGRSTVTASSSGVQSDGKTQSTITVKLKYANGDPAPGKTVTLSQGTGSSTIVPVNNGLANNDGTAIFTVTDAVAETVTYTAKDTTDNVTVEQTVTVTFTSSDPKSSSITAIPSTVTANGSEASTVTVTLKFANGDLATGKPVTLSQGSGHSRISPATTVTDGNGQATFTVTNGYAETVTYTAKDTLGNVAASQTVAVTFTPYAWVVNSLADTDTPGTLRHAINYAPVGSAISFQSGLKGTITLGSSLPTINKDLTIDGGGATVTISGNNQYRIFRVDGGAVSIKNLTIAHGRSAGNNGSDLPNIGSGEHGMGGGLYVVGGTVSVDHVAFYGNAAIGGRGGGSIYGYNGGWGGGGYGGAVYLNAGSLTIAGSLFDGNSVIGGNGGSAGSALGGGGGNGYGGAIFVGNGSLIITDSTLTNNTVTFGQGGTANYYPGSNGAALYADLYNYGGQCGARNVSFGSGSDSYCNVSVIHTVTFDAQGGSPVSSIDNVISGSTINAPAAPTRSGHAFEGWYRESSCANAWNFSTDTVTGDITLYAKFTSTHSVSIGSLTGGSITASPTSATSGTTISLTVTPDSGMRLKAGTLKYHDGTTYYPISDTSFTMPAADVTVSAEFEPIPVYSVNIGSVSGGSITADPSTATSGTTINLIITPDAGMQLKAGTLKYNDGTQDYAIDATSFTMPAADVLVTAEFETPTYAVGLAAIAGVTAPARGAAPVSAITETSQYSGTVTWNPAGSPFAANTVYTATITLTPKIGYTLDGVTANFFAVAGATATNAANSGVVTAVFPATAAVPVDLAAIAGVTAPARGAAPVPAITETEQYTGTVNWSPVGSPFAANTVYTATISLTPKAGYTLTGVSANFFVVDGAAAANAAGSGVVTAVFPATAAAPVDLAAIAGVTAPARGAAPVTAITETEQYTGTVTWNPAGSPFAANTVYTATISLTPKTGYTLNGVAGHFFTVEGAMSASNDADSGVIVAVFPATAAAPVDLAVIAGVTAPARGAAPVTAITETEQYTGTVTWNPAGSPFAANTVYIATITLTPKAGYTLTGVSANFFTVDGATATNAASSGVVTAVFPATAAVPVMSGTVTIGGTPKFGEELTVDIGGLSYSLGTGEGNVLSYQWRRNGEDIPGATTGTYTLVQADIDKTITVTVMADGVHATGNVTSGPTAAVEKADTAAPGAPALVSKTHNTVTLVANELQEFSLDGVTWRSDSVFTNLTPETLYTFTARVKETATHRASAVSPDLTVTTEAEPLPEMAGTVSISGTAKFGEQLTAVANGLSYSFGIGEGNVLSYQWQRGGEDIPGVTTGTYTLGVDDIGKAITVTVTADGVHATGNVTSEPTAAVEKADTMAPGAPVLASKTHNSVTLVANSECEFRLGDGAWQSSNVFTNLTPDTEYTFTIRVKATLTHKASPASPALIITTETEPVPVMTGIVSISGTPQFGEELTVNISGLTYSFGAGEGNVLSYLWQRNGEDIPGATAGTYTLGADDIGKAITVTVTADGTHATGSVTSEPTAAVEKADAATPSVPALASKTHNCVTLVANSDCEFRQGDGPWQSSNVFINLTPEAEYTFTARVKATATHKASPASLALTVTTDAAPVTSATLSLTTGSFDKSPANQADVTTAITWNNATMIANIKAYGTSIGSGSYTVSGDTLTIKKDYLATQANGSLPLTVEFDQGDPATLTITIMDTTPVIAPSITTTTLPGGTVGAAYSQTLVADGDAPITWTIDTGSLPDGLSLSGNTISGTPMAAGTSNFTVKATNGAGSDTQELSIAISSEPPVNTLPARQNGVNATATASVAVNNAYTLDLTDIFEDADNDQLAYFVLVDDATEYIEASVDYSFTPETVGTTTLVFRANDGKADSTDIYTVTLTATAAPNTTVSIEIILGVTAPVKGAAPVTTIAGTAQYTGTVVWDPGDNRFEPSTTYTATITLAPNTGYTLDGVTENFFIVAGATATNAANSGVVTAVFPATAALQSASVSPTTVVFDLDEPSSVTTFITWGDASTVTGVAGGSEALELTDDYTVDGNQLTITEGFLSGLGLSDSETVVLEISFDVGEGATLTIEAAQDYVPGTDATLIDLTVGGSTVNGFAAGTYSYSVELPHGTLPSSPAVTVGATAADEKAAVVITPAEVLPGSASVQVIAEDGMATETYTIVFTLGAAPNTPPALQSGVNATVAASVMVNAAYTLDLTTIFEDAGDDELTYEVSVNEADPVAANVNYSFTPATAGTTTLVFTANDGTADSTDTYTVTLTASAESYPLTITAGTGGSIVAGSNGSYAAGTVINIGATASADYSFSGWTSTAGTFGNTGNATTTFTMPAGVATITAEFTYVGGGGYDPDPPTPPTPPQPPKTVVSDHVETGDDTRLEHALREAEQPAITLTENQAGFSSGALAALSGADVPLTLVGEEIELQLPPNWLELSQYDNATVQITAERLTDDQQAERLANASLDSSTGIFEVCGKVFDLSVLVHRDDTIDELHQFDRPIAVTVDLSELGELTEEQIAQLTAVRLEVDAAGNLVPVSLGGVYDPLTKAFTFNTDRFSLYSVMYLRQPQLEITLILGRNVILVNGEERNTDVAPQIENGRTLVPLRFVAETLGVDVAWIEASKTVVITLDGAQIQLPIGYVNPSVGLDVPAQLVNGRTLVPLRYVAENLGATVNWYEATGQVKITRR